MIDGGRFRLIAALVPPCGRLVDIGTDHGIIPIALLKDNRVPRVLATDIHAAPLAAACRRAADEGLPVTLLPPVCSGRRAARIPSAMRISDVPLSAPELDGCGVRKVSGTSLCADAPGESADVSPGRCEAGRFCALQTDGLEGVMLDRDDVVIISGMGGERIAGILGFRMEEARKPKRLILQPQTYDEVLRRFLYENQISLINEIAVIDGGHPYLVLVCGRPEDGFCDPAAASADIPPIPPETVPGELPVPPLEMTRPALSPSQIYFGVFLLSRTAASWRAVFGKTRFDARLFVEGFTGKRSDGADGGQDAANLAWFRRKLLKILKRVPYDGNMAAMVSDVEAVFNSPER